MKDADTRGMCSAREIDGTRIGYSILVRNQKKKRALVRIKRMGEVYIDYRARVTQHYKYRVFITFTATCCGRRTRPSSGSRTNP